MRKHLVCFMHKYFKQKVVDAKNLIIEYEGKRWRPVKNSVEMLCASFDNVPVLMLGRITWIDESWNPNDNDN